MTEILLGVTAFASALAALFAILGFFRRGADPSEAVRSEADRARGEAAAQARELREELSTRLDRFAENQRLFLDGAVGGVRQTLETKLDASDRRAADAARNLREELTGNFKHSSEQLSGTLKDLGTHQHERLERLAARIEALTKTQGEAAEALRKTVEERLERLRADNEAKLEQMRATVDEKLQSTLEARLGESFRTVSEQLKAVHQGLGEMQTLATGVGDLKKVLTNVKTRGTWGEVQLGMLLEQFLSPEQYVRNAQCRPDTTERVEFAVRFAARDSDDTLLLPIDAKFPHEDYERLVQASEQADAAGAEEAAAALEARVKSFAKSVSEKYINPPLTTDFAVLFLPTESLFAEILRRPGFFDSLQRDYRVTLAGPTTLASMLNAFQMGFRSLAIQKRSSEVWKLLGAVRKEFENHGAVVTQLKKQLNAASNTIDKLGTRTNVMNRKLREVEMLPGTASDDLLGLASPSATDDEAGDEAME